jgi:hypothetical protein
MEYGAHLRLIEFEGARQTLAELRVYARRAAALGYRYLCANDHLLFGRPWLDGPTALAATFEAAEVTLATTVCLPVVRGPAPSAEDARRDRHPFGRPARGRCRRGIIASRLCRDPCRSRSAGGASTRRSVCCARCFPRTPRASREGSTQRGSQRRAAPRQPRRGRRSGLRAGARPRDFAVSLASATAGSRPATTRPPSDSGRASRSWGSSSKLPE